MCQIGRIQRPGARSHSWAEVKLVGTKPRTAQWRRGRGIQVLGRPSRGVTATCCLAVGAERKSDLLSRSGRMRRGRFRPHSYVPTERHAPNTLAVLGAGSPAQHIRCPLLLASHLLPHIPVVSSPNRAALGVGGMAVWERPCDAMASMHGGFMSGKKKKKKGLATRRWPPAVTLRPRITRRQSAPVGVCIRSTPCRY